MFRVNARRPDWRRDFLLLPPSTWGNIGKSDLVLFSDLPSAGVGLPIGECSSDAGSVEASRTVRFGETLLQNPLAAFYLPAGGFLVGLDIHGPMENLVQHRLAFTPRRPVAVLRSMPGSAPLSISQ